MSTNHNRIRVADLETNEPNKILKTNAKGELEFTNANLQSETYNALDCTTEGKALDARQGKVLKDMIDSKNVDIASDVEMQISAAVSEDKKVVSRSKLFNWWEWIKSQTQTISGMWNFTNKVTLAASNFSFPSLIIPNGTLTLNIQNGAIERDGNGQLFETHSGKRSRLLTTNDDLIIIPYKYDGGIEVYHESTISEVKKSVSPGSVIGKIANNSVQRLNVTTFTSCTFWDSSLEKPNIAKIEVFLQINNGLFANNSAGSDAVNQVKLMEYSGLNNYGYKNYQELLIFVTQNYDPLNSQWARVDFPQKTTIDGVTTNLDKSYYLRDALNTRTFGPSEASFSFVFVNTLGFADETNANKLNSKTVLRTNNYALVLETMR